MGSSETRVVFSSFSAQSLEKHPFQQQIMLTPNCWNTEIIQQVHKVYFFFISV